MIMEQWRDIMGAAPAGLEWMEYFLCACAALIVISRQLFSALLSWALEIWDLILMYDVFTWVLAAYIVRKALIFFNIIKP